MGVDEIAHQVPVVEELDDPGGVLVDGDGPGVHPQQSQETEGRRLLHRRGGVAVERGGGGGGGGGGGEVGRGGGEGGEGEAVAWSGIQYNLMISIYHNRLPILITIQS